MKIVSIIGARPQFVKAGVISHAIKRFNDSSFKNRINEIVLHTGQHFDLKMSGCFLEEFKIRPAYNLGIQESLHGKMTARMLEGIEEILLNEKPDAVLVYGDTNSTMASALAAVKLHIPIAHIEAGLRSFNMKMPEEINRIVTDRLSRWLFCPTETAIKNLEVEGIGKDNNGKEEATSVQQTFLVGDIMLDAFLRFQESMKPGQGINEVLGNSGENYYLATIHRSENTDERRRLCSIIDALELISESTPVFLPLHPRTAKMIKSYNIKTKFIRLIDPVGYSDMIFLLKNCRGVFTDSGGLQKEAYFMEKQCVTLRDETEWVELLDNGFNVLVGAEKEKIIKAENNLGSTSVDWRIKLYGDGNTGDKILQRLINTHT